MGVAALSSARAWAAIGATLIACHAAQGGTSAPTQSPGPPPVASPAPPPPDAGTAAATPASTWAARVSALRRTATPSSPSVLELDPALPMVAVLDVIGVALHAGFGSIEFARGAQVLALEEHDFQASRKELEFMFFGDRLWRLDWKISREPWAGVNSGSFSHLGEDVETALGKWTDAPCRLSVLAETTTSLSVVLEGAMGISHAHRCVGSFSLGVLWSSRIDQASWSPAVGASGAPRLILRVPPPPPIVHVPSIREERTVVVDGVAESWSIRWRDPPVPVCLVWHGCSCDTFGPSQRGQAELVRSRPGHEDEVFPLSEIYDRGLDPPGGGRGLSEAVLPTWPAEKEDIEAEDNEATWARVQARKPVKLLELRDYDHDGRATEFLLPIGGVGCVFHHHVAVGITRTNPRLHVLGSAKRPDRPLPLKEAGWRKLAAGGGRYVESTCGNHGSDQQIEIAIRADRRGIRGTVFVYEGCGPPGRLISRDDF